MISEPTTYDLENFDLASMTKLGARLRAIGAESSSMEDAASQIVSCLYESLVDKESNRSCALVRLFRTVSYGDLEPDLQTFGTELMPTEAITDDTRCLTMLATAGDKSEWKSRDQSLGHKTIPLPSPEVVKSIPMVSQLVAQLGIDVATVINPDPDLVMEVEQHTYNVFFVSDAQESPYIPAKDDFVTPHKIRSVLGCGGLLPSGEVFAVLMFTRLLLPRTTADVFRNAALNIKLALLPFDDGPIFASNSSANGGVS